ncbi:outer mitochondrial transmembrane helix translocase isoform X3 [Dasypus novemcinctus]|uniref:outer mitochondrial transmembrane helix translocase isoform X3 n=1 Tax=Dasypus novemcinctus TaxID=9361 RepID=UPI0039C8CBAD
MVHAEAFSRPLSRNEVVGLIFRLTIFGAVTYFTIKWMVDAIDPTRKQKVEAQKQAEKLMKQIGVKNVKLSEYEMSIAAHLVDPLNMHVTWSDIAGLDDVITDLKDTVILPIKKKHLFENSRLLQPPKGVLLYGPPGCGKTLIAKATAKEAGCRFINLQPSTLTDKWYGESQKLAAAVFSLAIKLQPSIIFIDEIDSFLRNRSSSDHEATAMMKAQFMSLWDGLDTDHSCQEVTGDRTQDLVRDRQALNHLNDILSPVPCCFDYCSFAINSETRKYDSSNFILLFQDGFRYSGPLYLPYKFYD